MQKPTTGKVGRAKDGSVYVSFDMVKGEKGNEIIYTFGHPVKKEDTTPFKVAITNSPKIRGIIILFNN